MNQEPPRCPDAEYLNTSPSSDSLEQTEASVVTIQEYERPRMGQELHDSTSQLVGALMLSLARLERIEHSESRGKLIDEIRDIVTTIDNEIQSLALIQFPAELRDG